MIGTLYVTGKVMPAACGAFPIVTECYCRPRGTEVYRIVYPQP